METRNQYFRLFYQICKDKGRWEAQSELFSKYTNIPSTSKDGLGLGSNKKDEELRGKAIKVVDLLQHSAELGNLDALYALAHVSLVRGL